MTVRNPEASDLEPVERASRDELQALQLTRLQQTLKRAYDNVPHYKRSFDAADVHPDDLKELADLAKFPFTSKRDFRDNYPFGLFAVPRETVVRIHASSGTTGTPIVVGYTAADIEMWTQVVARSIRAAGGRAGDIVQVSYGYGLFTGGLGAHYGAERVGCTVIPMGGGQTKKQIQMIRDLKPSIIMVTPSYMLNLIEEFVREGLDPKASSLEVGIFGAEPWTEAMRHDVESRAGMDALDIYGLSEVIGPGVASECIESKDGPVVWEDHFYPEIIDPATGKVLPDGREGELVFTSLTKEAVPVIRFRTRDLTRLLPPTSRSMRRMDKVTGRSDDMLIIRGVNVFPTQVEELVLKCPELSPHYVMRVSRSEALDEVVVVVELNAAAGAESVQEPVAARLEGLVKSYVGITVAVEVNLPGTLERSAGKARHVIDTRPRAIGAHVAA